jgi:hypothetical protein
MKKLIFTIIAATLVVIAGSARADLTPQQFGEFKNWAEQQGFIYKGVIAPRGAGIFVFENAALPARVFVPTLTDTVGEAKIGLMASFATATMMMRQ